MRDVAGALLFAVALFVFVAYINWAAHDATRRRKSPLLVLIAVVLFFPFGLLAWLLFRPPIPAAPLAPPRYKPERWSRKAL